MAQSPIITSDHPDFAKLLPAGSFALWNGHSPEWNEAAVVADANEVFEGKKVATGPGDVEAER